MNNKYFKKFNTLLLRFLGIDKKRPAPRFKEQDLVDFGIDFFMKSGAPSDIAQKVSESLVKSNLAGLDSSGLIRVIQYLDDIKSGQLDPKAQPSIRLDKGCIAVVDGHHGFGQVAADYGIDIAIEKTKTHGVGIIGLCCSNHVGRLGGYLLKAVKSGYASFAVCNGGGPNVAPYGAIDKVFGTNPIACAIPVKNGDPILIDATTGASAEGVIRLAKTSGKQVNLGTLIDAQGKSTANPNDFYEGGAIVTIGEHKGSALSLMVEMLGGILTGAGCSAFEDSDGSNGVMFIVFDPSVFRNQSAFLNDVERMKQKIKGARKAHGFSEIMLPGEPEFRIEQDRKNNGIPIDTESWKIISDKAIELNMPLPIPIT